MPRHEVMSLPTYTPLPSEPPLSASIEPLELEDEDLARSQWLSLKTARKFFVSSCILSLAISATNLAYLSSSAAFHARQKHELQRAEAELKRPNVYLGLENVPLDPSRCRSRVGYPGEVYTYDARDPRALRTRIHGPDDNITLTFGGPIRAVMDMYIADYGLENCTVSLQSPKEQVEAARADAYLVSSTDIGGKDREFLGTLTVEESQSRPFHCRSRLRIWTEWRCEGACVVRVPLQGVTRRTETAGSTSLAGFRIHQYESIDCIPQSI